MNEAAIEDRDIALRGDPEPKPEPEGNGDVGGGGGGRE